MYKRQVLGWCLEVCFCTINTGQFVNRGFLNGPVCPIYGFGMVLVIVALTGFSGNLPALFLGGMVLTSAIELAGGWALKKLFHTSWWDYSDQPFNIGGYICLKFSLAWGLCVVVVMRCLLYTSTVFNSLSNFLNSIYMTEKRSGLSLATMSVGAVLNLVLNGLLIPLWGIQGAAMATFVSYFVVFLSLIHI